MTTSSRRTYPEASDIESDLPRLDFDADYARLLGGKDVIVVGPAATLLGTNQGRVIDSFELVVRFNTAIEYMPFADELASDVGSRTDVLYCNNEVLGDRIVKQEGVTRARFIRACEAAGITYFVGVNNDYAHGETDGQLPKGQAQLDEFRQFLGDSGVGARCRMLFATPAVARGWLGGYIGRTGFLGLLDLLRHAPRRLHVTGMTFYHKGGHLFLEDCVAELDPLRNHRGVIPQHMLGHNSYRELRIAGTLAECFGPRLRLDAEVRRLLEAGAGERPAGD